METVTAKRTDSHRGCFLFLASGWPDASVIEGDVRAIGTIPDAVLPRRVCFGGNIRK